MPLLKEKFERYAELKKQIKELTYEMEDLQPEVQAMLEEIGPDAKVELPEVGAFSFMRKKKWTYSEAVSEKTVELKTLKDTEEADGTAQYEENLILIFKEKKPQTV